MNSTPLVKWTVHAETDDYRSLIRKLRDANDRMAQRALNHSSPLHDDVPDGIWNIYIEVTTLTELTLALGVIKDAPMIRSVCIYASVDNEAGIRTEARIGQWTTGRPDNTGGKIIVASKARTSKQEQAMTEAIKLLEGAME